MKRFFPAACWAIAMIMLAAAARLGWVERDAAISLLLLMPLLAFAVTQRGGGCALPSRGA